MSVALSRPLRARASTAVLACFACIATAGCGARPAPTTILDERFEAPEAQAALEHAPDLYASANRARAAAAQADGAGRREVAEDHATRARLLLEAAIAEADRLALEAARLRVEADERELELAYGHALERREAILDEVRRIEASQVARAEAAAAFERATEDEGRRYRGRSEERAALHREAAVVLRRRARLLLAAAEAQGADDEATDAVEATLERASGTAAPAARLALTEDAVRAALVALGGARAATPGPSGDERAALFEEAAEAGFVAEQGDRGVLIRVTDAFRGNAAAPTPAGRRKLARLAAIVQAHPHGAVQVTAYGAGGSESARRRAAQARAERAQTLLVAEGVPEARLATRGLASIPAADALLSLEVTFVAYGVVPASDD